MKVHFIECTTTSTIWGKSWYSACGIPTYVGEEEFRSEDIDKVTCGSCKRTHFFKEKEQARLAEGR